MVRLLILTGDQLRHKYLAIRLKKRFADSKIILEKTMPRDLKDKVIRDYFEEFNATEKRYFSRYVKKNQDIVDNADTIEHKSIKKNEKLILDFKPDLIIVHGSSIIPRRLIRKFPYRMINLHAGLSPYYRGSATNVWPFFNKQLQYVGMTVHFIDKGIDTGEIILQDRPEFEMKDNTHTIGCKCTRLGCDLLIKTINYFIKTKCLPSEPCSNSRGEQYYIAQFGSECINTIKKNIAYGLVPEYIDNPIKVKLIRW